MKKHTMVLLSAVLLMAFSACSGILSPDDLSGNPGDFIVDVQRLTLNANELATIEGNPLKLIVSGTPDFATRNTLIWESSDPGVAAVDQSGNITTVDDVYGTPQTAVIKVYVEYDPSIYAVCPVTVYPDYGSNRAWDFAPEKRTLSDYQVNGNTDMGNGMIILGATGSGSYENALAAPNRLPLEGGLIPKNDVDQWAYPEYPWASPIDPEDPYAVGLKPGGEQRSMTWNGLSSGNPTEPDSVPPSSGWKKGSLRTGGVGRILSVAAIKGPFSIEVRYTTNTNNELRWAELRIGDREGTRVQGSPSYSNAEAGGGGVAFYSYEKTDVVPYVYVESQASIRIHEVIIKDAVSKLYSPVPAFSLSPADTTMTIGSTKEYKTNLRPGTITKPTFTWAITSGGEFGRITGAANGPSVQVTCIANGSFTLEATVTTTNPNDGGTDTQKASCTISALAYTPITGVTISGADDVEEDKTVTLNTALTPANATSPVYLWEITSGSDKAEISGDANKATVSIKGKAQGTAEVKVTVTTTDPANSVATSKTDTKTVTVKAAAPPPVGQPITWLFNETTAGTAGLTKTDTTNNYWNITTDKDWGNGMTVKQGHTSTQIRANQASGGITGCLQHGGTPRLWAEISGITGSFTIEIKYSGTGGSDAGRYPTIQVGSGTVENFGSVNGTTLITEEKTLTGNGSVIKLDAGGGNIRVYSVKITPQQ